ncbi:MAG: hypothetical protein U1F60_00275 [Planctomycetota bacterium]
MTVLHPGLEEPTLLRLEHSGIRAIDVVLDRHEVEQLLASFDSGRLQLPGAAGGAVVPGTDYYALQEFIRRSYAHRDFGIDWPCEELFIQGGGFLCDDLPERLSKFLAALPTMDPPIQDRRSLERALNVRGDLSVSAGGRVNFRRPCPLRLDRIPSSGDANEFEILVEAHGELESFQVSLMPDSGHRSAFRLDAKDFEPSGPSRYRCRRALPQPGAFAVCLSVRDGLVADELRAGVPSDRLLVHQQFDPGCHFLEGLLFPKSGNEKRDARDFECGVAWLLHLCGCAAMHLGRKEGKDLEATPDVVARTPSGDWIVGECSVAAPTNLKVDKLRERAQAVAAQLRRASVLDRVHTVLFVGVECDTQFPGVEMVDGPRLRTMLERVRGGRPDGLCVPEV